MTETFPHRHSLTAAPIRTQAVITTLEGAGFPQQHPCYVSILDSLADIEEIAGKWGDKGYWSKRFGVSISKGTSKALKYKALFELQFQVDL